MHLRCCRSAARWGADAGDREQAKPHLLFTKKSACIPKSGASAEIAPDAWWCPLVYHDYHKSPATYSRAQITLEQTCQPCLAPTGPRAVRRPA